MRQLGRRSGALSAPLALSGTPGSSGLWRVASDGGTWMVGFGGCMQHIAPAS